MRENQGRPEDKLTEYDGKKFIKNPGLLNGSAVIQDISMDHVNITNTLGNAGALAGTLEKHSSMNFCEISNVYIRCYNGTDKTFTHKSNELVIGENVGGAVGKFIMEMYDLSKGGSSIENMLENFVLKDIDVQGEKNVGLLFGNFTFNSYNVAIIWDARVEGDNAVWLRGLNKDVNNYYSLGMYVGKIDATETIGGALFSINRCSYDSSRSIIYKIGNDYPNSWFPMQILGINDYMEKGQRKLTIDGIDYFYGPTDLYYGEKNDKVDVQVVPYS